MAKTKPTQKLTEIYASQSLERGQVYTRDDLRGLFAVTASSINNGIFKPAAFDSVWLFVTEQKTADRTQYDDVLAGDELYMEGQTQGGTDHLIKEHVERGLELLLFYRKKKYEHSGAGFTYQGKFLYQSHDGSGPTKFVLRRETSPDLSLPFAESELEAQGEFDPTDVIDARKRIVASVVRRQGQANFRRALLKAYGSKCAVTDCAIEALLEAAHIVPYQGVETNVVSNGLLLRADIHTLFDLGLLWVEPTTLVIKLGQSLKGSEYEAWRDRPLRLPEEPSDRPSVKALQSHLNALKLFKVLYEDPKASELSGRGLNPNAPKKKLIDSPKSTLVTT